MDTDLIRGILFFILILTGSYAGSSNARKYRSEVPFLTHLNAAIFLTTSIYLFETYGFLQKEYLIPLYVLVIYTGPRFLTLLPRLTNNFYRHFDSYVEILAKMKKK